MSSDPSGHPSSEVVVELARLLGPRGTVTEPDAMAPYLEDRRGHYRARAALIARPQSTEEVSRVVRLCHERGVAVVPQGGNTGLVGGSVPDESGSQILLSLDRMRRIRDVDPLNFTMTVEAGCILADVQAAADEADLLFPLSLAAQGSCRIGGNLATNAGGTGVIHYGNARDLVLGLEVVLADGEVWDGLRSLRKDNTGYCLKQLFVGCEGTLGIITAAVLKLFPKARQVQTALVAVPDAERACRLLGRCRRVCGDTVTGFEYIDRSSLALVFENIPSLRDPLDEVYAHYVLVELSSSRTGDDLKRGLEQALEEGFEEEEVLNATIAASTEQSEALWRLREAIPEATRMVGLRIGHDVSVPVARVPEFLDCARAIVARVHPEARVIAFGHMGDGNIHFNLTVKEKGAVAKEAFLAPERALQKEIYDLVHAMGGSFSAEHGIGRLKREELAAYRSPAEVGLMRKIKAALDPGNTLNPGKLL